MFYSGKLCEIKQLKQTFNQFFNFIPTHKQKNEARLSFV